MTLPVRDLTASSDLAQLEASAHEASRLLKLMANEQRLLLLCRIAEEEVSVGDLSDYVGLAQSAVSQHLAKLRAEGVVSTRREAQTIYYRLSNTAAREIINVLCSLYGPGQTRPTRAQ
ncbi:MAG: ArsR/SmtB family transcription factor [Asticcacaulis sp.]